MCNPKTQEASFQAQDSGPRQKIGKNNPKTIKERKEQTKKQNKKPKQNTNKPNKSQMFFFFFL